MHYCRILRKQKSCTDNYRNAQKKTEYFDGGLSTGIATIHEGKLYTAKVIDDVDTLLCETDAINFPGTTGIIHSRTGGNLVSIYDFPATTDWMEVWNEPLVDSKYVREDSFLKPTGPILYEGLWSFHKEGRLHSVLGEKPNSPGVKITKFWIE